MNCVLGSFYLFMAVGGIFEAAYGYQKTLTLTLIGLFLTYHVPIRPVGRKLDSFCHPCV